MLELTVVVDTNDADYRTQVSEISEADLEKIAPLIQAIKNFKPYRTTSDGLSWPHGHNFPQGECLREDLGEKPVEEMYQEVVSDDTLQMFVEEYCPSDEYGFHTIISIEVTPLVKKTKLL